jgi:hypothetical protein
MTVSCQACAGRGPPHVKAVSTTRWAESGAHLALISLAGIEQQPRAIEAVPALVRAVHAYA